MKTLFCIPCHKKHSYATWKHKNWNGQEGWGCGKWWDDMIVKEWIPDSIKDARKTYKKELLQPYRGGEFSNEYKEAYPEIAKGMVKEGVITEKQYKNAKDVWKGDI